jgi:tetratricopeptide (TPR) repeat protein
MNENTFEKLVRYLDGELRGEELKSFENTLAQSIDLQEELNKLVMARDAVRSYGLREQVAATHKEMMQELNSSPRGASTGKTRSLFSSAIGIAASFLLILLSFCIYQYATVSSSKLFTSNYQAYNLSVSRDNEQASELERSFAIKDFGRFQQEFANQKIHTVKENFLAGQVFLSIGQLRRAIDLFSEVSHNASEDNLLKDDAEYYLALTYLKNDQPEDAMKIFRQIKKDKSHLYHDEVSNLLIFKLGILSLKTSGKQ